MNKVLRVRAASLSGRHRDLLTPSSARETRGCKAANGNKDHRAERHTHGRCGVNRIQGLNQKSMLV